MRTSSDLMDNKQIKSVINSVISAIDTTKLEDKDKTDITNKLNGVENNNDDLSEESDIKNTFNMFEDDIIKSLVELSDLDYVIEDSPKYAAFDISEAIYVYCERNKGIENPFVNTLTTMLEKMNFKPSPSLNDYNDLDTHGKTFYKALVLKEKELNTLEKENIEHNKIKLAEVLKKANAFLH